MNKKLILLILLLPLVMMFSIYTSTSSVSLNVAIGVSKIEIIGSKYVYLDLDKNEQYFVNYTVYPLSATNKKVNFKAEPVGEEEFATLKFENGYIVPESTGVAKVTLSTVDGGFNDSFIVRVDANSLKSISCSISSNQLVDGSTAQITTTFHPENFYNKLLTYSSSDESVATVSNKGLVKGRKSGVATITIASVADPNISEQINIEVLNKEILIVDKTEVHTNIQSGSVDLIVETDEKTIITYSVLDENDVPYSYDVFDNSQTKIEEENGEYKFNYTFLEDFYGIAKVVFTISTDNPLRAPYSTSCTFYKSREFSASFDKDVITTTVGSFIGLHNEITLNIDENADVSYEISANENLRKVKDSATLIQAVKPGVNELTVTITSDAYEGKSVEVSVCVVVLADLTIAETINEYGLERMWTVGKYEADGVTLNTSSLSVLATGIIVPEEGEEDGEKINIGEVKQGEGFASNIKYYSSDSENVLVESDGTIKIIKDDFVGNVNIICRFEYSGDENNSLSEPIVSSYSAPITIRCVGNGVNIRDFAQLYSATKEKRVVVLQNNIINDFGIINGKKVFTEDSVTKIKSTYNTTYYDNVNKLIDQSQETNKKHLESTVKILINFKADVYGNGFEINAKNVTYKLNSTGGVEADALFKGPLKFVSLSDSASSSISVNAQDNICFAVYDNVDLVNVNLKSCDLAESSQGYDLNDLTYTGTTVEVFGDKVSIKYSRITNGRTLLRIFGALKEEGSELINDSSKVINVDISNCILSCAREFIIRMGSNCFLDGTLENPAPYIHNDKSISFPVQKTYKQMSAQEKEDYDNKFIKTFVNLKNSVLKDSGLFCIGIDSHFSGGLLENGVIAETWKNLARTSYGAKLTIEGDVRMYDWKNINSINSDTLIETNSLAFEKYKLDVKELINSLATNTEKPNLNKIVYNEKDANDNIINRYVHGGIAFFGGGKNYGVADFVDYEFVVLNGYEINLSDVGRSDLQAAAGNESFYFLLNDASIGDGENGMSGFLPKDQKELLDSENAYAPIYK